MEKEKMMDDLISRQAAIDALVGMNGKRDDDGYVMIYRCDACDNIYNLPYAQPERWIPVTERLPEVGQDVMLSVGGMYSAEGCLREDGDWTQFRWDAIQRKEMVTAWMPLPEPWRGEEHERMDV